MTPDEPLKKFVEAAEKLGIDPPTTGKCGVCDRRPWEHTCDLAAAAIRQAAISYGDERVREDREERVRRSKSFCGCPMCEHHTTAYALRPKPEEKPEYPDYGGEGYPGAK